MTITVNPTIEPVERSPLLLKAKRFSDLLREDNARLQKYFEDGGDHSPITIESLSDSDSTHIEMNRLIGALESFFKRKRA
jgi:hypothetical protein